MRVRSFLGVVATLLAIATSTSVSVASSDWPKSLTLVTGPPGGVYYVYGEALAQVLTEKLGIAVNPLPTQGSVHNVKLVESGGAQLGMTTMGVGLQGWNGTGDWTNGKQLRDMRALFPLYDTPFQAVVLQRSGIATLEQLDKKRIGVGSRAGTGGTYMPAMLKVLGISAEINYGSFDNMATELLAGRIDAVLTLLGTPVPAVQDVEAKEPVTFITLSPEQIEAIRKALPEFSPSKIAAGTYRLLDKDYVTIGVYNFAVGRAGLPDDLVYQLVKAVFENQPRLLKAHSSASETLPQNAVKNTFLPFHPGAVRYYREIGTNIPDPLAPTN
jgi:TRAP transporter TAXI family solute receptor